MSGALTRSVKIVTAAFPIQPRRPDREFLPAALSIIETPPSPVRIALLCAICLLFLIGLGWSILGRIDIVSVAQGKIQPKGRVKTIQSLETGRVVKIAAWNGRHVTAGSVLFELDPADTLAYQSELAADAVSFRSEVIRRAAAIAATRSPATPHISWPDEIPTGVAQEQNRVLVAQLGELRAEVANLEAQVDVKKAELQRLDLTIAAQGLLVDTLKQRVDMRMSLLSTGSAPKSAVLDARENYQTQAANLAYQQGQRGETEAGIVVAQLMIDKAYEAFIAENNEKMAEAERQAVSLSHKLAAAILKGSHLKVTAPVDGIIQGSTITTEGQVVNTAEEVMRIVPDNGTLEVEAYLSNRDVGFVRPGQPVVIKLESFPFTRYGTLQGTVERVASDAISVSGAEIAAAAPTKALKDVGVAGAQPMDNLVFPMTIALKSTEIQADGTRVPLTPGMSVSAEVRTGNRRFIDYLLSPILEIASNAMRER